MEFIGGNSKKPPQNHSDVALQGGDTKKTGKLKRTDRSASSSVTSVEGEAQHSTLQVPSVDSDGLKSEGPRANTWPSSLSLQPPSAAHKALPRNNLGPKRASTSVSPARDLQATKQNLPEIRVEGQTVFDAQRLEQTSEDSGTASEQQSHETSQPPRTSLQRASTDGAIGLHSQAPVTHGSPVEAFDSMRGVDLAIIPTPELRQDVGHLRAIMNSLEGLKTVCYMPIEGENVYGANRPSEGHEVQPEQHLKGGDHRLLLMDIITAQKSIMPVPAWKTLNRAKLIPIQSGPNSFRFAGTRCIVRDTMRTIKFEASAFLGFSEPPIDNAAERKKFDTALEALAAYHVNIFQVSDLAYALRKGTYTLSSDDATRPLENVVRSSLGLRPRA